MAALSKLLQFLGLVIVPMAIFYYWFHREEANESKLMFGELGILGLGAAIFMLGRSLHRS